MALTELMGWVKSQRLWQKRYRGKLYGVSCRQLGTESTKEASRGRANEWWTKKQAEIDAELGKSKHPAHIRDHYHQAIENHRLFAKWHRRYGEPSRAEPAEQIIELLQAALEEDDPPYPLPPHQMKPIDLMMEKLDEGTEVWEERLKQIKREEKAETSPTPKENTIRSHIDDYLTFRRTRVGSEKNTLGTYNTFRFRLMTFRNWVDPFAPITELNEALWERYYIYLSKQVSDSKISPNTMGSTLGVAREFIRSRYERRFIDLPRNLNSRSFAISAPAKAVETMPLDEIQTLLSEANELQRLYILLMMNCGMYGVDIAMLKHREYRDGRITRKRTKTRSSSEKVPVVDYVLWKETNTLLAKHQSNHPELVLVNANNEPLWKEVEKDGKISTVSNIKCSFFRLRQKTGINKPLKLIRKTSASLLEKHPEYGRYAEYFLGEVPHSVAHRHYIQPSREQFDNAIRWLGSQYGIE